MLQELQPESGKRRPYLFLVIVDLLRNYNAHDNTDDDENDEGDEEADPTLFTSGTGGDNRLFSIPKARGDTLVVYLQKWTI